MKNLYRNKTKKHIKTRTWMMGIWDWWVYFFVVFWGVDGLKIGMRRRRIRRRGWILKIGWNASAALFRIRRIEGKCGFVPIRNEEMRSWIRSVR